MSSLCCSAATNTAQRFVLLSLGMFPSANGNKGLSGLLETRSKNSVPSTLDGARALVASPRRARSSARMGKIVRLVIRISHFPKTSKVTKKSCSILQLIRSCGRGLCSRSSLLALAWPFTRSAKCRGGYLTPYRLEGDLAPLLELAPIFKSLNL